MLIKESYAVDSTTSFGIEIAAAPPGQKLPLVVVVHGNFGLSTPFGDQLRSFTLQLASLGFVAALRTMRVDAAIL
jgi:dienelactone hydrolase